LDNKINKKLSSKLSLTRNNSGFGCTIRKHGKLSLITKKRVPNMVRALIFQWLVLDSNRIKTHLHLITEQGEVGGKVGERV
jgi:hypothetical protein